jgi:redox-sensitive bicupin YhaK (pirin superfamily)
MAAMITARPAGQRGVTKTDWLDSRHTFSFGAYYDPDHMGFGALRVINDDRVAPGAGFPPHDHRDMEILTYVLEGALAHRDSLGNGSVVRPGEVQRMTAGSGITHSEFNHSGTEPVHFLQVWILPDRRGLPPSYEQRRLDAAWRDGGLRIVVSPDGRQDSVRVHQDATVYVGRLAARERVAHPLAAGRQAWLHVARGTTDVSGTVLSAGDGAAVGGEPALVVTAREDAEFLLFDLA